MSEAAEIERPPSPFRLMKVLVLLGAAIVLWAAPASWRATDWAGPLILATIGLEPILWPESLGHRFGARAVGIFLVAAALAVVIRRFS